MAQRLSSFPVHGPIALGLTAFLGACAHEPRQPREVDAARAYAHVRFLASDALEGRGVRTPGLRKAADYISYQFARYGLVPAGVQGTFLQPFRVQTAKQPILTENVVALLPGSDPVLSRQAVVIGAHYDHLGRGFPPAWNVHGCKGAHEGILFPGADDNASGTAVLLELARTFATREPRPKRSILFVAFSAEEMGLVGSRYFVGHLPAPIAEAVAMINLDMVGRLRESQGLSIEGMGTAREWHAILDRQNADHLRLRAAQTIVEDSDHAPFYLQNHPVLFFFSGQHPDYHCQTDTVDRIQVEGLGKIGRLVYRVAQEIAGTSSRPAQLTFARVAVVHPAGPLAGPRLGIMPDYTSDGGLGVTDIMSGGPAEKAGILPGDLITKLGNQAISSIESYMAALKQHKIGDTVDITLRRGRATVRVQAILGDAQGPHSTGPSPHADPDKKN